MSVFPSVALLKKKPGCRTLGFADVEKGFLPKFSEQGRPKNGDRPG